jgi:plasmid stabilization system protein ParE
MNPSSVRYSSETSNIDCADFFTMAERELTAFFRAVAELFGPEEAKHSAAEWLRELEAVKDLPVSPREWRSLTAKVAIHLANRAHTSVAIS